MQRDVGRACARTRGSHKRSGRVVRDLGLFLSTAPFVLMAFE